MNYNPQIIIFVTMRSGQHVFSLENPQFSGSIFKGINMLYNTSYESRDTLCGILVLDIGADT